MEPSPLETLAARGAAEHHQLAAEEAGARCDFHSRAPHEPRAVKENGLLGQPLDPAPGHGRDPDLDAGIAPGRPIDLLRRLGGRGDTCRLAGFDGNIEAIAARKAARRGEQHDAQGLVRLGARKEHTAGRLLEQARHARLAGRVAKKAQLGHAMAPLEPVVERAKVGGEGGIVSHVRR